MKTPTTTTRHESGARVLLADDDRFFRRAAEAALQREGFTVLPATNGDDAVRQARADAPDLVLLDLIMPGLQGFEVLRLLKADPETAPIPVLVLSNLGQESDVEQALEAGAAGYLVKSHVALPALVGRVREALKGRNER